jgi:hypothetical protein
LSLFLTGRAIGRGLFFELRQNKSYSGYSKMMISAVQKLVTFSHPQSDRAWVIR